MTISALGATAVYFGLGSTGPFSLQDDGGNPILFEANSEIIVQTTNATGEYDPAALTLTITTDYLLTGAGLPTPGAVTLTTPLALGAMIIIRRRTPITQNYDLIFGGDLSLENLEEALDKLTRLIQEQNEKTERALMFSATETALIGSISQIVPAPLAGRILGWGASGQLENVLSTGAAGPQGIPGVQGLRGRPSPGLTGDEGPEGAPGVPGKRGLRGWRGRGGPAIAGTDGEDGAWGPPGRRGLTGGAGVRGPRGVPGFSNDGEDGAWGAPGRKAKSALFTINVLDYGADPTGTNDSATAIQAALNAASLITTARATVHITSSPLGNSYKIASALTWPANVNILCDPGVRIFASASMAAMLQSGVGTTGVRLRSVWLRGGRWDGNYLARRGFWIKDGNGVHLSEFVIVSVGTYVDGTTETESSYIRIGDPGQFVSCYEIMVDNFGLYRTDDAGSPTPAPALNYGIFSTNGSSDNHITNGVINGVKFGIADEMAHWKVNFVHVWNYQPQQGALVNGFYDSIGGVIFTGCQVDTATYEIAFRIDGTFHPNQIIGSQVNCSLDLASSSDNVGLAVSIGTGAQLSAIGNTVTCDVTKRYAVDYGGSLTLLKVLGQQNLNVVSPIGDYYPRSEQLWVPAIDFTPQAGGAAKNVTTIGATRTYTTIDYDAAAYEEADAVVSLPSHWNNGQIRLDVYWSHAATVTNFNVVWFTTMGCAGNNESLATIPSTGGGNVTDTGGTTNNLYISPQTPTPTSPAANDIGYIIVGRVGSDGADTLAIDARLHGVKITYTANAISSP